MWHVVLFGATVIRMRIDLISVRRGLQRDAAEQCL